MRLAPPCGPVIGGALPTVRPAQTWADTSQCLSGAYGPPRVWIAVRLETGSRWGARPLRGLRMGTGCGMARFASGRSTALATGSSSGPPKSVRGRARVGQVRCPGIRLSKCSLWKSCRGGSFSKGSGWTSSPTDANLNMRNMSSRRFPCWSRLQVLRRNRATASQFWNGSAGPRGWPAGGRNPNSPSVRSPGRSRSSRAGSERGSVRAGGVWLNEVSPAVLEASARP